MVVELEVMASPVVKGMDSLVVRASQAKAAGDLAAGKVAVGEVVLQKVSKDGGVVKLKAARLHQLMAQLEVRPEALPEMDRVVTGQTGRPVVQPAQTKARPEVPQEVRLEALLEMDKAATGQIGPTAGADTEEDVHTGAAKATLGKDMEATHPIPQHRQNHSTRTLPDLGSRQRPSSNSRLSWSLTSFLWILFCGRHLLATQPRAFYFFDEHPFMAGNWSTCPARGRE